MYLFIYLFIYLYNIIHSLSVYPTIVSVEPSECLVVDAGELGKAFGSAPEVLATLLDAKSGWLPSGKHTKNYAKS